MYCMLKGWLQYWADFSEARGVEKSVATGCHRNFLRRNQ